MRTLISLLAALPSWRVLRHLFGRDSQWGG